MTYQFRVRTVHDYDHLTVGLGRTQRELKIKCCLIAMQVHEEHLGREHHWYIEAQARAIGWASN